MASTTTSLSAIPTVATVQGYSYLGCYSDSDESENPGSSRLLGNGTNQSADMRPSVCADFCGTKSAGAPYAYFGLEFAYQCWCGNELHFDAYKNKTDESKCDTPCYGQQRELCGGTWFMNVYRRNGAPTTSQATGTSSSPPSSLTGSSSSTIFSSATSTSGIGSSTLGNVVASDSPKPAGGTRMSSGTIAAAVLGALIGLALILVGCLWILRRKKKSRALPVEEPTGMISTEPKELHAEHIKAVELAEGPEQLGVQPRAELPGHR